ncbi:hypothetical protein ACH5RR_023333 [Cinchona calisaya]|uniref:CCHC-type domain-containing protein n=1 Tax=Cinchona calisaya TaxID=153742 RepID=A0ABD2ZC90_9GENT
MTAEQSWFSFTRVCVEIDVNCELSEQIPYENEKGEQLVQIVTYEWVLSKCRQCKKFGHLTYTCPLKPKKVWVPKKMEKPHPPTDAVMTTKKVFKVTVVDDKPQQMQEIRKPEELSTNDISVGKVVDAMQSVVFRLM